MTCSALLASFLLVASVVLAAAPSSAITVEEFRLRSGTDIVALCATPVTDPLHAAAIHMCHGFGAGKLDPLICPPAPSPSRNETVAKFLDWAKGNPHHLTEPAVETIGRCFISEFPCRR